MRDSIQFSCPACGKGLRVPVAAAGFQGPCPLCAAGIVGPIPDRGIEARLADADAFAPFPKGAEPPAETGDAPAERSADESGSRDPFDDFAARPPQPEAERGAAEDRSERSSKRLWVAILVLACLLSAGIAFVSGYLVARSQPDAATSGRSPGTDSVGASPTTAPGPAADAMPDVANPPSGETPGAGTSRAALEAFLSAEERADRAAYALDPSGVLPLMKQRADDGDGPIPYTAIEEIHLGSDLHHYRIRTEEMPSGFPVTLIRTDEGWRIDWRTFDEFYRDRLARFARGELGEEGRFHVFVRREEGESSQFTRYRLTTHAKDRRFPAFAKRGTPVHAELTALLDREPDGSNPDLDRMLEARGVPVVLELAYRTNSSDQPFLLITDLLARHWRPES